MTQTATELHPRGWADEDLRGASAVRADREQVARCERLLAGEGWAVVDLAPADAAAEPQVGLAAAALVGALAQPIDIFAGRPMWRALYSDVSRPDGSSGGVGEQKVHLDFVNASHPPDLVVLYCLRPDPRGGGASVVAGADAVNDLSEDDLDALARPIFCDGTVRDLNHVGDDINPFAVWAPDSRYRVRWTGKLLESTDDARARAALQRLAEAIDDRSVDIPMRAGQLLLVNQRRAVHGRRALGPGQEGVPHHEGRLLMHAFGRFRD